MEASPGRKPRNPGLRSAAAIAAGSPLREIVTEEIRQAILSGRYKPGQRLIEDRQGARRRREFAAADRIRDDLAARGVLLEDGTGGTRWKRK